MVKRRKMLNKEVEEKHTMINKKLNEMDGKHAVTYFKVVAIGWLDSSEEFEKGNVPEGFMAKLKMVWDRGYVIGTLGLHECDFCEGGYGTGERATSGEEKILWDRKNKVQYTFPKMIFHYISEHNFKPSDDFIKFVMESE